MFATSDLNKEIDLLCDGKCAVTGTKFDTDDVWFISTPDLALYPFGLCLDAPVCGEAKDFSLQVCPYFSLKNYQALSSEQKDAMSRNRQGVDPIKEFVQPTKFAAVRVRGFQVQPTASGMRYLPSRRYTRVEFWKERSCEQVAEGAELDLLLNENFQIADGIFQKVKWPDWAHASFNGNLNGLWPWNIPGARDILLQAAREALAK
ncbi:hypothetical protein [Roseicitreum antarcticum]|uniref:hypothetical protein n=1 Tax=Roseicitreum antarcticum TaxID=564137 RepID=UPI000B8655FD|nr:hypothetical protein [Roseicitreum antarcticum]